MSMSHLAKPTQYAKNENRFRQYGDCDESYEVLGADNWVTDRWEHDVSPKSQQQNFGLLNSKQSEMKQSLTWRNALEINKFKKKYFSKSTFK